MRGVKVDHVTLFRWVQRFAPLLIDAACPSRHAVGDRWFVDGTYVKVNGVWRYGYWAIGQHGQTVLHHNTGQHENSRCEADHGWCTTRLRPMRGLKPTVLTADPRARRTVIRPLRPC